MRGTGGFARPYQAIGNNSGLPGRWLPWNAGTGEETRSSTYSRAPHHGVGAFLHDRGSMRSFLSRYLIPGVVLVAGCSDSSGPDPSGEVECDAADAASSTVAVAVFQALTVRTANLGECAWVTGSGANYLVVPQFPTETATRALVRYSIGNGGSLAVAASEMSGKTLSPAARLDNTLRQIERNLAPNAGRAARELRALALAAQAVRGPSLQQVGSTRTFKVLSSIPENSQQQLTFANVTAVLRFAGQNILIY